MTNPASSDPHAPSRLPEGVWDVAVIGAGVAGGLVAGLCARAGWKTILVEKESWPRRKVCGCCLNERGMAVLEKSGVLPYLPEEDRVALNRMELVGRRSRAVLSLPGGSIISRGGLDAAIARWAQSQGALFLPKTLARPHSGASMGAGMGARTDLAEIALEVRGEDKVSAFPIHSRFVVGAWGLGGDGLKWDAALASQIDAQSHMGAGTVLAPTTDCALPFGTLLMAVGNGGYVGVVRLGDGSLDVAAALGVSQVRNAGGPGALACQLLERTDRTLARACAEASWKGTPPLTRKAGKIANRRVLLVGDAVGYVEPFTGEGMTWALVGAQALSEALLDHLASIDSEDERSTAAKQEGSIERLNRTWQRLYCKRIQVRQRICWGLSAGLRFPLLSELGIGLLGLFPRVGTGVARWLARP